MTVEFPIIGRMPDADDAGESVVRELMAGRRVEENFRRLYCRYYSAVYNFLLRKGLKRDDCRDLAQEVFVAVYMGIGSLRSEAAFLTWLFSIARHMWLRNMEKERRGPVALAPLAEGPEADEPAAVSLDPDPLHQILDQEKVEVVRAALDELPERVQECLRARMVEDLSYREIGQKLGISENTVAVHVHRGVRSLQRRLKIFARKLPAGGELLDGCK